MIYYNYSYYCIIGYIYIYILIALLRSYCYHHYLTIPFVMWHCLNLIKSMEDSKTCEKLTFMYIKMTSVINGLFSFTLLYYVSIRLRNRLIDDQALLVFTKIDHDHSSIDVKNHKFMGFCIKKNLFCLYYLRGKWHGIFRCELKCKTKISSLYSIIFVCFCLS